MMRRRLDHEVLGVTTSVVPAFVAFLLWIADPTLPAAHSSEPEGQQGYANGIALALAGEGARAESVFVSMLSRFPHDAAAFTNLGNLRLLEGDPEMALAFYERAFESDSTDPGIVLNQAASLLLLGRDSEAVARAQVGLQMAGGPAAAASLLGLRFPEMTETDRGAGDTRLTQEEVLDMLKVAAGRVPADSARAGEPPDSARSAKVRQPAWRPAGPRADDALAQPAFLYWKR